MTTPSGSNPNHGQWKVNTLDEFERMFPPADPARRMQKKKNFLGLDKKTNKMMGKLDGKDESMRDFLEAHDENMGMDKRSKAGQVKDWYKHSGSTVKRMKNWYKG